MKKTTIIVVFGLVILLLASCDNRDFKDPAALNELAEMEFGTKDNEPKDIAKLKEQILSAKEDIRALKAATGRLASFYNALGEEYRRLGMFAPALEAYQNSLDITGGNHAVLYKAGLMAAQLYKLEVDPAKSEALLAATIKYYQNAIQLGNDYEEALYALAVLELFERKDLQTAKDLVYRALAKAPEWSQALFLAARIAVEEGNNVRAMELYRKIMDVAHSDEEKMQAQTNLEELQTR